MRKIMIAFVGLLVGLGCGLTGPGSGPTEKIAVESETMGFDNLLWLPDGRLMVFVDLPEKDVSGLRWYVFVEDWTPLEMSLPYDERCYRGGYYRSPGLLPDGRISFLEECLRLTGTVPDTAYLMAYDLKTGRAEQLVEGSLPLTSAVSNTQFSWNPKMARGMGDLWGDVSSIYWLTPAGYEFPDITISENYQGDTRSWSLAENEAALEDPEKVPEVGMAQFPAWSPDGKTIAFMATTGPIGRKYADRHLSVWSLYLMDPEVQEPKRVLTNIHHPFLVKWSPDGKWLLIGGQIGGFGDYGYWLYAPESEELSFLLKNIDARVVWAPDSTKIAYMACEKFSTRFDMFGICVQNNLNVLKLE